MPAKFQACSFNRSRVTAFLVLRKVLPVSGLEPRTSSLKSGALPLDHRGRGRAIRHIDVYRERVPTLSLAVKIGEVKDEIHKAV